MQSFIKYNFVCIKTTVKSASMNICIDGTSEAYCPCRGRATVEHQAAAPMPSRCQTSCDQHWLRLPASFFFLLATLRKMNYKEGFDSAQMS